MSQVTAEELDRVRDLCRAHGIQTVECMIVDTWGIPRGKRVPVEQFLRGSGFPSPTWSSSGTRAAASSRPRGWTRRTGSRTCTPSRTWPPSGSPAGPTGWPWSCATPWTPAPGEPVVLDSRRHAQAHPCRVRGPGPAGSGGRRARVPPDDAGRKPVYPDIHCYSITKGVEYEPVLLTSGSRCGAPASRSRPATSSTARPRSRSTCATARRCTMADATVIFKYVVRQIARGTGTTPRSWPSRSRASRAMACTCTRASPTARGPTSSPRRTARARSGPPS